MKKYYIETGIKNKQQKTMVYITRGVNGIEELFKLFYTLEDELGKTPELDQYVNKYVNIVKQELFVKGIRFHNKYGKYDEWVVRTPEWIRENWFNGVKAAFEERAAKAWRSNMVEIEMIKQLREYYKEDKTFTVRRHCILDQAAGVDLFIKKRNKNGDMVHLYAHVLVKRTEEASLQQKGIKEFNYRDKYGNKTKIVRDFTSKSHIPFYYDHSDLSTLIPPFDLQELVKTIEHHVQASEKTSGYNTDSDCPMIETCNIIRENEKKAEKEAA